MFRASTTIGVAGGLLLLAAVALIAFSARPQAKVIPYQEASAIARGETIYSQECAACHGSNLEGERPDWRTPSPSGTLPAPPHDASGHTWHHPDELLFSITKYGSSEVIGNGYQSDMPGFGDRLSDEDILAVLAFIKATWPERVVDAHNARNAAASY